ncbi:MAG: hypothetical protein JW764_03665 [Chlorobiaceae bacterium]|nr:hypothetical protein [Chlorobiaceae bacterium]
MRTEETDGSREFVALSLNHCSRRRLLNTPGASFSLLLFFAIDKTYKIRTQYPTIHAATSRHKLFFLPIQPVLRQPRSVLAVAMAQHRNLATPAIPLN